MCFACEVCCHYTHCCEGPCGCWPALHFKMTLGMSGKLQGEKASVFWAQLQLCEMHATATNAGCMPHSTVRLSQLWMMDGLVGCTFCVDKAHDTFNQRLLLVWVVDTSCMPPFRSYSHTRPAGYTTHTAKLKHYCPLISPNDIQNPTGMNAQATHRTSTNLAPSFTATHKAVSSQQCTKPNMRGLLAVVGD